MTNQLNPDETSLDPRSHDFGADRWLTDARAYNLVWLGRWIERAYEISRVLLWSAENFADTAATDEDTFLRRAAGVRQIPVDDDQTGLDALLFADNGYSLRACLYSARYNATFVGPLELSQRIADALDLFDEAESATTNLQQAAKLLKDMESVLAQVHGVIEESWFHAEPISEEEVYRRFVQQQQQQ